jgi:hypothetical protein
MYKDFEEPNGWIVELARSRGSSQKRRCLVKHWGVNMDEWMMNSAGTGMFLPGKFKEKTLASAQVP